MHRELARPSVTLLLLWNEYVAGCRQSDLVPYRYSFFNEQYRRWVKSTGAAMRIARDPGESIGSTGPVIRCCSRTRSAVGPARAGFSSRRCRIRPTPMWGVR